MRTTIFITDIEVDASLQTRVRRNEQVVEEYTASMMDGDIFPPVVLFDDGTKKYLADGFHRLEAAVRVGRDQIDATVKTGKKQDAFLYSLRANIQHGLRRSNDDKRYAVRRLLDEIEYADASDREIAQLCGVSHPFVARIRADMQNPACRSESAPIVKSSKWTRDRTKEVETLPPPVFEDSYDQDKEVMQEMAQELEVLTDRLSLKAMDATDEEKAMAAETIQSLRDEVKKLTFNLEATTKSRDQYQNQAAEAIRQCERYKHVIKKLNRQISQLQAKLDMPPTQDETVPF